MSDPLDLTESIGILIARQHFLEGKIDRDGPTYHATREVLAIDHVLDALTDGDADSAFAVEEAQARQARRRTYVQPTHSKKDSK